MIEYRPPICTLGGTGAWHMLLEIEGCFCTHGTPLYRKQYVPFLKCLNSHEDGKIFRFFQLVSDLLQSKDIFRSSQTFQFIHYTFLHQPQNFSSHLEQ